MPDHQTEGQPRDSQSESAFLSLSEFPRGYILKEKIGEGGFGQVWKAEQTSTGKHVAVKIFVRRSPLDWLFLRREVERLANLDKHPHIVTLLDAHLDSEPPAYVMELMSRGTLRQLTRQGQVSELGEVLRWLDQLCEALAYVHGRGLIHCDLKPDNILLDDQGYIRVTDFGQSRVFTEASGSLGTLYYMAPEQAVPTRAGSPTSPDVRWDIYALGATVYALLTYDAPHSSRESDEALMRAPTLAERLETYRRIVAGGFPRLAKEITRSIGDYSVAAIVLKCLNPDPSGRYQSIETLTADLRARKEHRPISPFARNRLYRARLFARRHRAALAFVIPILLAALGFGAWRYNRSLQVERLVDQGIEMLLADNFVGALGNFKQALALDPSDPRAVGNLAITLKELLISGEAIPPADFEESLERITRLVENQSDPLLASRLWNVKGNICQIAKRYDDAADAYTHAVERSREVPDRDPAAELQYWTNLGMVHALRKDYEKAESSMNTAIQLVADYSATFCHPFRDLSMLHVALAKPQTKETIRQLQNCYVENMGWQLSSSAGVSNSPLTCDAPSREDQDEAMYFYLTVARFFLSTNGDPTVALTAARKAAACGARKSPVAERFLAWAFLRNEEYADARSTAQRAIELGDNPPTASHLIISAASAKLGLADAARAALVDADRTWPEKLRPPDSLEFSDPGVYLWFESASELAALKRQVALALGD